MIAAIWAQSLPGVIGDGGKIPWNYPGDLKRFKRVTLDSTIVMGRHTWESIGRPLPRRRNVVVSNSLVQSQRVIDVEGVELVDSPETLLFFNPPGGDVWFIGGGELYAAVMPYLDMIDVTYVPDDVRGDVLAPEIPSTAFEAGELLQHEDEPALKRRIYTRKGLRERPFDINDNRRLQEAGSLSRKR